MKIYVRIRGKETSIPYEYNNKNDGVDIFSYIYKGLLFENFCLTCKEKVMIIYNILGSMDGL